MFSAKDWSAGIPACMSAKHEKSADKRQLPGSDVYTASVGKGRPTYKA